MADESKNDAKFKQQVSELHGMAAELIAASSQTSAQDVRSRMASVMSGGYDFADTLHNIYLDYGYPAELKFFNFWNMYRRFGIAKNVVELPVNTGWSTPPEIKSSDKQFIKDLEKLNRDINLWTRFKGLDTRQRVGRYAGMFMRVKDGKQPDQPLESKLPGVSAIVEMMPLYESQLQIIESEKDPTSERFGQPIIIQYSQSAVGSRNEEANNTINIHWTRIVFVAEGSDNGFIYGIPALEPVYNSLMDLRKVIGGGAEGFYKNAAQSVVFNLTDPKNATGFEKKLEAFNKNYDEFSRDRTRRALWTPGMEATTLDSKLTNPKEFFMNALNDVAAGSNPVIPATILIGQQTGRLASNEDGRHFLSGVQSRRENFGTELVRANLDWCIEWGILPAAEYDVEWDDLLARSENEKLDNADKMAKINESQFKSGGTEVFSGDEIREAAGHDPEDEEEPGSEGLDDDEGDSDEE